MQTKQKEYHELLFALYWTPKSKADHWPLPSFVLAFLMGGGCSGSSGDAVAAETCSATAIAAAAAAAATAAAFPLKGLLELNSLHLAPKMVIIFDMGILGFFLAIIGLGMRWLEINMQNVLAHLSQQSDFLSHYESEGVAAASLRRMAEIPWRRRVWYSTTAQSDS